MMQFRVVVPPNVKQGQMLRIRCPDGTEGDVRVPKGLKPGNSFIFEMPVVGNQDYYQNDNSNNNNNNKSSNNTNATNANNPGTSSPPSDSNTNAAVNDGNSSRQNKKNIKNNNTSSAKDLNYLIKPSFLDREILDKRDFLTALAVGVLIGLSIVSGFLVGVLLVTNEA